MIRSMVDVTDALLNRKLMSSRAPAPPIDDAAAFIADHILQEIL